MSGSARSRLAAVALAMVALSPAAYATDFRVETFNASLNRATEGALVQDLSAPGNFQASTVAKIVQTVRPDILLINEFDYVPNNTAANLFNQNYLNVGSPGFAPTNFNYRFTAPSNTGIATGFDLNHNGVAVTTVGAPGYGDDAKGFGQFPGQYGMAIFSKYPIVTSDVRTFQNFLWRDMPGALLPTDPTTGAPWYSPAELNVLPLSSKSHWDIPINVDGTIVHVLASHPTPPTFDGPEDRNGTRNHDEIRFWSDYVTPGKGGYIYDDSGKTGGLAPGQRFVLLGDMNADPLDGDSTAGAIQQLLNNPLFNTSFTPTSPGGPQQSLLQGGANLTHKGDPAFDTADFADTTPGNLRADYVLPSVYGLAINGGGVFWPLNTDPLFPLVGTYNPSFLAGFPSSDHRSVYLDLALVPEPATVALLLSALAGTLLTRRRS